MQIWRPQRYTSKQPQGKWLVSAVMSTMVTGGRNNPRQIHQSCTDKDLVHFTVTLQDTLRPSAPHDASMPALPCKCCLCSRRHCRLDEAVLYGGIAADEVRAAGGRLVLRLLAGRQTRRQALHQLQQWQTISGSLLWIFKHNLCFRVYISRDCTSRGCKGT